MIMVHNQSYMLNACLLWDVGNAIIFPKDSLQLPFTWPCKFDNKTDQKHSAETCLVFESYLRVYIAIAWQDILDILNSKQDEDDKKSVHL